MPHTNSLWEERPPSQDCTDSGQKESPKSSSDHAFSAVKGRGTDGNRMIALLCIGIFAVVLHRGMTGGISFSYIQNIQFGDYIFCALAFLSVVSLAEIAWRSLLVFYYKPVSGCSDDLLPECTVIVPAFNEGQLVLATLRSIAESDYPIEKLHLIAVDDGSTDDTWEWIQKAQDQLRGRLSAIRLPRNSGKRHALYAGIQQAAGDVLVTVDSDSIVTADTLRNLVTPLALDGRIGAVAGNVRVLNTDKGIIPKMLDVVFTFSFDFIRASQSMVRAVMCTPGALTAYRKSAVMRVLQEWLHQTFRGQPANIGEDRAMTNLILKGGHRVTFQRNAVVFTEVPTRFTNLCKMYLRWARSNVRETIVMTRFIFTPFWPDSMLGARLNLTLSWIALIRAVAVPVIFWKVLQANPTASAQNFLLGVLLASTLPAVIYAWKYGKISALWAYAYGIYFSVSLSWIIPYGLLTVHKSGWLTRQNPDNRNSTEPQYMLDSPPNALARIHDVVATRSET